MHRSQLNGLDRFTSMVLNRPWIVMIGCLLIMLALANGSRLVTITNDYRVLFKPDNPSYLAFNALKDIYAISDRALIAVAPIEGAVFTRNTLDAIEQLTEAAWQAPYAVRVDSLTNYPYSRSYEDDLVVEPLVKDARSLSKDELTAIRSTALDDVDIAGRLVSQNGRVGGIVINFIMPDDHDAGVLAVTEYLSSLLNEFRTRYTDISFYLTGEVAINRAFFDATQDDLRQLMPIVFAVIVVISIVLLRSLLGTVAICLVLLFSVGSTVGLVGWTGTVISPTNSGIPIIVTVIAVAHAVHIVSNTLLGMKQGLEKKTAIAESLHINYYPVFLTSLTTSIGFLSLNASESPPFHVLGNFVAFGVLCAMMYSFTFLPALLSVLPIRTSGTQNEQIFFEKFADFICAHKGVLLWSTVIVTVVLVSGISRLELTDNWTKYFDDRYQFRKDTDFIIENLSGVETLEYSLQAGRENGITDPEYLRQVEAFAEWFRQQMEVRSVQAFSDLMSRLNKNLNGDNPEYYRLPDNPQLAAQYLLLYELSLPFGRDLNDRIDVGKTSTRMTVVMNNLTTKHQKQLDSRAQAWVAENAPGLTSAASGFSIVIAHLTDLNIHGMLRGTIGAMALISLILIVVFRSVRIGLISLIPNFIPAAMSFGLWGFLVGNIGMAASVITAIAFGIVVDDTIHFLSKYLRFSRQNMPAPEAIRATFRTVGHALWSTTIILAAGFLVFSVSGFEISWTLGYLVAITILFALATDFFLLPALLLAIDKKGKTTS